MKSVQLKVNSEKLVSSLANTFTNTHTFLAELMQNARRAGSNRIEFSFNTKTNSVMIEDYGCGISDIEALLTVAESGWDLELVDKEHPFGIGFLSALFSCEHIEISSTFGKISSPTADILSFKSIDVIDDPSPYTSITLTGLKEPINRLSKMIEYYSTGFPINVFVRIDAEEGGWIGQTRPEHLHDGYLQTEVGHILLSPALVGNVRRSYGNSTRNMVVYLQGIEIYKPPYSYTERHIVHLDSSKYLARLPDRDKLVNEERVLAEIHSAISNEVRKHYEMLKATLPEQQFLQYHEALKVWDCLDLLNDIETLPTLAIYQLTEIADLTNENTLQGVRYIAGITRDQVASDEVSVYFRYIEFEHDEGACLLDMFHIWAGSLFYDPGELDINHWLFEYIKPEIKELPNLKLNNPIALGYFCGEYVHEKTILCDSYSLTLNGKTVEVSYDEHKPYLVYGGSYGISDIGIIQIKEHMDSIVLCQVNSFSCNDSFQSSDFDRECDAYWSWCVARTATDPTHALKILLPNQIDCPTLYGKTFKVKVHNTGLIEVLSEISESE